MAFADNCPENCPPPDAISPKGMRVFHLLKSIPIDPAGDFRSKLTRELSLPPVHRTLKQSQFCQSCGLSVYTNLEDIRNMQKVAKGLNKKVVGVKNLEMNHGKIKSTPTNDASSHHTWWPDLDSSYQDFEKVGQS